MRGGPNLLHALGEGELAFVEPGHLGAGHGVLALGLRVGDVAADGHEVADVVVEELEPLLVAAVVEEVGLVVEEVLDLEARSAAPG